MSPIRTHLISAVRIMLLLVLFNGLACAIGHGQMLRSMFDSASPAASGHAHDRVDMSDMAGMQAMPTHPKDHSTSMPGMDSPFGDCFFAGSLLSGLLTFALIYWLLRHREPRPRSPLILVGASPRATLPNLNPRAP